MPYSLKVFMRNQFSRFKQGSITVLDYEARFYELSSYVIVILPTKYERIQCFVQGLRLSLWMAIQSLAANRRSFIKNSHYGQTMEEMYRVDKGKMIRGHIIRVESRGAKVAHNLEVEVLRVATLHAYRISTYISLVGLFMSYIN